MNKYFLAILLITSMLIGHTILCANENIELVQQSLSPLSAPSEIAVSGNYALAVGSNVSMFTLDISDPNEPELVATFNTPGVTATEGLAVTGNTAVLFHDNKISWVDISNPVQPLFISSVAYNGGFGAKAVIANTALVIANDGDLLSFNFCNPQNPVLADSLHFSSCQFPSLGIIGNRAYLAGMGNWIELDVTDPSNITITGTIADTGQCSIRCHGNDHIYAVEGSTYMRIFALNQDNIITLCSTPITADGIGWVCSGDGYIVLTYVNTYGPHSITYYYRFINVANPYSPITYEAHQVDNSSLYKTSVSNDYFFMSSSYHTNIYQVSPGGGAYNSLGTFSRGPFRGILMNSDCTFLKETNEYLKITCNPVSQDPEIVSIIPGADLIASVAIREDLLLLTTTYEIETDDGWNYDNGMLKVYNCEMPENPQLLYTYDFPGNGEGSCSSICINDSIAYFAVGGNLLVGNITSHNYYLPMNNLAGANISCLRTSGNYLITNGYTQNSEKLFMFDISNPAVPALLSSLDMPYRINALDIHGNYAFAGGNFNSLKVIDISNPNSPSVITSYPISFPVRKMDAHPNYLAVITSEGLRIFNLCNLPDLSLAGYYDRPNTCNDFVIRDNLLLMAESTGLGIYDIGDAIDLCIGVHDEILPEAMMIHAHPNPFSQSIAVDYNLSRNARIALSIYNIKGQKVFYAPELACQAGVNSFNWDGKDTSGKRLPAGIYFLSIQLDKKNYVSKLTLLK